MQLVTSHPSLRMLFEYNREYCDMSIPCKVLRYTPYENTLFDDDNPRSWGKMGPASITFNEEIADRLLEDFAKEGRTREVLLVHCTRGINRSPAVGIALNDIFNLGQDSGQLKATFPESNWFVYDTLRETAQKLHI